MSSFLDLARNRQSTRRYLDKPVPRDVIDRCLEAARLAPSACNSQPWRFLVVDSDPLRRRLAQAAEEGLGTCWLGWFDEKAVKNVLGLARNARIDILLSLGHPADTVIRPKNRLNLDDVRRYCP